MSGVYRWAIFIFAPLHKLRRNLYKKKKLFSGYFFQVIEDFSPLLYWRRFDKTEYSTCAFSYVIDFFFK